MYWRGLFLVGFLSMALPVAAGDTPAPDVAPVASSPSGLDALFEPILKDPLFQSAEVAIHVANARNGEEVFAYQADRALQPASTMKVVTAAAALRTLGPAYRFSTEIHHDGELSPDGVLNGNLYVRGTGDPTMVLERLWKLVFDLKVQGVREIKGDVVFDDSFMDRNAGIPGWNKEVDAVNGPSYYPPLGALSLNYNTVAILVGPGASSGSAARVELETRSPALEVINKATTGGKGSKPWLKVEREVEDRKVKFTVTGSVPMETEVRRYYRTVADATAYFSGAFAEMLKDQDVKVKGRFLAGKVPRDAEKVLVAQSESLSRILMDTNKQSNNFMAEQVLKTMGAVVHGEPGTTEKGLQVVASYLSSLGLPSDDYQLVNGSGLARGTTMKPDLLTAVLVDMYNDRKVGAEFQSSLSIGGVDGTLRSRFQRPDEVGRLRGKTGSLNGVHCLVGYLDGADGEVYAFSFLVNDISGPMSAAKRVHNRFAETLFGVSQSAGTVADDEGGESAP